MLRVVHLLMKPVIKIVKQRSICALFLCVIIIFFMIRLFGRVKVEKRRDYTHLPEGRIVAELYTNIPELHRSNISCRYKQVLTSTKHLENWEVTPELYSNFSYEGIVNGSYVPENCNPAFKVAILVTFRHRKKQLDIFLPYMHSFLRKQNIAYKIYLIEQRDEKPWNKGLLYNIGAMTAIEDEFSCLILHDVDLLPLDERNLYVCTRQPRHMSACVDKFNYTLLYTYLVGGVLAIRSDQFAAVDGFSNRFHEWGGEDDDFAARLIAFGFPIVRFPRSMSRYTMLQHPQEPKNPNRYRIIAENLRRSGDGLGTIQYTSVKVKPLHLYTSIRVVT